MVSPLLKVMRLDAALRLGVDDPDGRVIRELSSPTFSSREDQDRLADGALDLRHVGDGRRVAPRISGGFARQRLLIHDDVSRLLLAHHFTGRKALRLGQRARSDDLDDRHSSRNRRVARNVHGEPMTESSAGGIENRRVVDVARRRALRRQPRRHDDDRAKKSGPSSVPMRNHFERTRSRYSRLMTAQSLAMSAHPLLDARGADLLEEDLVQRGLHELEALHARPVSMTRRSSSCGSAPGASSISKKRFWSSARCTSARSARIGATPRRRSPSSASATLRRRARPSRRRPRRRAPSRRAR